MTFTAFFLLLLSVTFHASWNLIAKKSAMSIAYYTLICMTSALCWFNLQFWTPVDVFGLPGKYYLFMACSVLSDLLYCCGLVRAYRTMEMSTAYPMMRSLPLLLLTAALTTAMGWGQTAFRYGTCGNGGGVCRLSDDAAYRVQEFSLAQLHQFSSAVYSAGCLRDDRLYGV